MNALKDFALGFAMAVCIAAGIALVLAFLFFGFQSPGSVKQALLIALAATSFMLVCAGGEIAASFLFAWNTPIGVKFMQFLGALFAVVVAFITTPIAIDALEGADEEKCRTVVEARIGPIEVSNEECDI